MNFENFNFNSLNELTFGQLINSEASAEQFVLQNKLVSLRTQSCGICGFERRVELKREKPSFRCRKINCRKTCSPHVGTWLEKVHLSKL